LDSVSLHCKTLLLYLQTNEQGEERTLVGGHDRRRGQLSYARRQAQDALFIGGSLRHARSK
jgi:hypothetical protein